MRAGLLCVLLFAPQDPAALVEKLKDDDPRVRNEASSALRALDSAALPALRAAANDPDPEVGARVRAIAQRIEYDAVVDPALLARYPAIAEAFLQGDHERLIDLVFARRSFFREYSGDFEAYGIKLLDHPEVRVRKKALSLLCKDWGIPRRPTAPLAREICRWTPDGAEDPGGNWLNDLAGRLYALASPSDGPIFSGRRASDPLADDLFTVVQARCGIPAAVEKLPGLVDSDSWQVSFLALQCVRDTRCGAAREQVLRRLRGKNMFFAAQTIMAIEDDRCRRDYAQLWRETTPMQRTGEHVRLLARSGDPETPTILRDLLQGPEPLACEAASGLAAIKDHGAVDRLLDPSVPAGLFSGFVRAAAAIVDAGDVHKLVSLSPADENRRNELRYLLVTHPDPGVRKRLVELTVAERQPALRNWLFDVVYTFKDHPGELDGLPDSLLQTLVLQGDDRAGPCAAEIYLKRNKAAATAAIEKAVLEQGEKHVLLLTFLTDRPSEAVAKEVASWKESLYTANLVVPFLEKVGIREAVEALERYAGSNNLHLQSAARTSLRRLRGEPAEDPVLLSYPDTSWVTLAERLAANEPGAREEARAMMKDRRSWGIIPALREWAHPEMMPALKQGLSQWDQGLAERVAHEGAPGSCMPLPHQTDGADYMRALAATDERSLAPFFVERLTDPDPGVRQVAMEIVGRWRVRDAVPMLQRIVRTAASPVRADALKSLAAIAAPGTKEFLLEVLRDNPHAAPFALARLGASEAAPAVARLLEDAGPQSPVLTALDMLHHPQAYARIDCPQPRPNLRASNPGWPEIEKLLGVPVRAADRLEPPNFYFDRNIREALERHAGMYDWMYRRDNPWQDEQKVLVQFRNGALEVVPTKEARARWREFYGIR